MKEEQQKKIEEYIARAFAIIFLGVMVALVVTMCSCTRTIYVPQTTIQRDSIYLTQYQKDSIYLHDSILIKEKGDTVWIEKWHTKFVERLVTDTMYVEHNDTIREPYAVEKPLSFSQRSFITLGKISLGVLAGLILAILVYLLVRRSI